MEAEISTEIALLRRGRKPLPPEQKKMQRQAYLPDPIYKKILMIGGSDNFTESLCNIAQREGEIDIIDLVEMAHAA